MKKGLLVLFILILLIPIVNAVPADPRGYCCEDTSERDLDKCETVCQTEGDVWYAEEYTVEVEKGKLSKRGCPIVRQKDATTGERRPFFAYPGDEYGYLYANTEFPLSDFRPEDIKTRTDKFACGEDLKAIRPYTPPPPFNPPEEMWNDERLVTQAENQLIGVELNVETAQYEVTNPIVEKAVEEGNIPPPVLPLPPPEIYFTGLATKSQQVQELKILVVLVQFSDEQGSASVADIEDMFFGDSGLASYFESQSYGKMKITGDVIPVWYTLSQEMGYYGDNYESNVADMIEEAVEVADDDIDYSQYDMDGDGIVDGFFVVHAGDADEQGGGNGPEIWSHYYSISPKSVDGVKVIDYETVGEESPVGIVIHEFGHYLGLPDMYDTVIDDGSSKGVGDWSIMGYGGYLDKPGSFDPWSKNYLGWFDSDIFLEVDTNGYYELVEDNAKLGMKYYLLPLSDSEYFYLENRHEHELMGGDDAGGIVVWHIDESVGDETGYFNGCTGSKWDCNAVNGDATHKMIDVEEADGNEDLSGDDLGDDKDPWYYSCGAIGGCQNNIFYSASSPSSEGYGAYDYDLAVSVYSDLGSTMNLGISLDGELLDAPVVEEDVEVSEEVVSTTASNSGSSGGVPGWAIVLIVLLVLVVLGLGVFVVMTFLKKGGHSISPSDYKHFEP
ncbi:MAG: M6 family metalloprotease domain-containing protein [Nanoarchaeota archaeon]|nr:M6 family metalloprotease domain-containing protein [Nanoarchaeota archaeon]